MDGSLRTRVRVLVLLLSAATGILGLSCARYFEERIDSPVVDNGRVTFRLRSPSSRTVQVAGDFNNWALGDAESGEVLVGSMTKGEDGVWELTMALPPGRYRYRYLLGEANWFLDPGNPRVVDDGRGGKANLLIVP
jgi:1,4-alpha-glucan branching enzyme